MFQKYCAKKNIEALVGRMANMNYFFFEATSTLYFNVGPG